jgi:8'-apo-carotenoid 13,14-cleaving dioxygenase
MTHNPYLTGNFAPVKNETTETALRVTGQIPRELNGQLLRIGPNPVNPDPANHHWFLGNGMVHGIQLRDGKADWYHSRFVRDDELVEHMGWPPVAGPTSALQLGGGLANTNIIYHAGQRLAVVEGGNLPVHLDNNLDTVARTNFGGTLPGGLSAHPRLDADTGELHAAVYSPLWEHIQHVVIDRSGVVTRALNVPVVGQPMVHDCMITKNYLIILDLPVLLDMEAATNGESLPYRWRPEHGARVGLLPRQGEADQVTWHEVDPCYVFHPMNGYEDEHGRVVLDVVRHPRMFATDILGPNEGTATLDRWVIDRNKTRVHESRLDEEGQEFPRIAETLTGKPYRYGYSVALSDGFTTGGLYKHDLKTSSKVYYNEGPTRFFMESVFVPRQDATTEDDGWLLAYVHDAPTQTTDVVILEAADLSAGPTATIHLPHRVPFGFHGNWVAALT